MLEKIVKWFLHRHEWIDTGIVMIIPHPFRANLKVIRCKNCLVETYEVEE